MYSAAVGCSRIISLIIDNLHSGNDVNGSSPLYETHIHESMHLLSPLPFADFKLPFRYTEFRLKRAR